MFTTDLVYYQIQQAELMRRAAHYRLVKSLKGPNQLYIRLTRTLGQLMVHLGQQLVIYAQPAH